MAEFFDVDDLVKKLNKQAQEVQARAQEQEGQGEVNVTDIGNCNGKAKIEKGNGNGKSKKSRSKRLTVSNIKDKFKEQLPNPDRCLILTFEHWQKRLAEKYNVLHETVQQSMPNLWPSLEFDLSVEAILHIKDIGQPFAGIVLGKPSSLKTVGLELFRKSQDTYYTDNFTAKSFVSHNSGLNEEQLQQIDLLPKIKNKCFLTPELAPTFAARDEDLLALLGIMTRVLDGYGYESDTGAQGHRGYRERMMFTWIGAAVDIPFKVHKLMTTLGPRLYFLRIPSAQGKTDDDYFSQLEHNDFDVKRDKIQAALLDYQTWLERACPAMVADDKFNSDLKKMPWLCGNAKAKGDEIAKLQLQKDAYMHIIKLGKLLAHLRGVVPTWHTHDTQGSEYGYTLPTIEEPDRAMQQLANLARGHALLRGRNYITVQDDIPLIVKVVLSTAPIERVTIFDVLLVHNGVLNVNEITESLQVSPPTARKTMLELSILGLVGMDTVDIKCPDGTVREGYQITLKGQFNWFLSEEFKSLRQGFKAEATKEKYPPREGPNTCDHIEEFTSQSEANDALRGGEISFTAIGEHDIYFNFGKWHCKDCKATGDRFHMENTDCKGGEKNKKGAPLDPHSSHFQQATKVVDVDAGAISTNNTDYAEHLAETEAQWANEIDNSHTSVGDIADSLPGMTQEDKAAVMAAVNAAVTPRGVVIKEVKRHGKIVRNQCLKCKEIGTELIIQMNNGYSYTVYRHKVSNNNSKSGATAACVYCYCGRLLSTQELSELLGDSCTTNQVAQVVGAAPSKLTQFRPIISVGDFFYDDPNIAWKPLPSHNLEQSPCYHIIDKKDRLYYCKLHPKIQNVNLDTIEHHCKYNEHEIHRKEIISKIISEMNQEGRDIYDMASLLQPSQGKRQGGQDK